MTIAHEPQRTSGNYGWRRPVLGAAIVGAALLTSFAALDFWGRPAGESSPPVAVPDATALWPAATSSLRFTDPVAAARGFAADYAGFEEPVVGDYLAGDSRSGEVEVRPSPAGPVTTVMVRQFGTSGEWWVLGAASANLQLESPAALERVAAPLVIAGQSTAFEANVQVEVRQDGSTLPLVSGYVMGGSMGEMGPFKGTFTFEPPTADAGAVILSTSSMEDGRLWEFSAVRVRFR